MKKEKKIWLTPHSYRGNKIFMANITFQCIDCNLRTMQEFNQNYMMFERSELIMLSDAINKVLEEEKK